MVKFFDHLFLLFGREFNKKALGKFFWVVLDSLIDMLRLNSIELSHVTIKDNSLSSDAPMRILPGWAIMPTALY